MSIGFFRLALLDIAHMYFIAHINVPSKDDGAELLEICKALEGLAKALS
jgi:hypothetical protein